MSTLLRQEAVDLLYDNGLRDPVHVKVYPGEAGYIIQVPKENLSTLISYNEYHNPDREEMILTCEEIHVPCIPYKVPDPDRLHSRGARRRRSWMVSVASALTSSQQSKLKLGSKRKAKIRPTGVEVIE